MLFTLIKIIIAGTLHFTLAASKKIEQPGKTKLVGKTITNKHVKTALDNSDTTIHYYSNRKISAKISPWKDGKRKILLFHPNGQITYTIDDTKLSYSSISTLKFRPDGSVEKINIEINPGASRYRYKNLITFSNQNEPEWKHAEKFPQESLDDFFDLDYFWDKNSRQWKKQEVIECQPVPKD